MAWADLGTKTGESKFDQQVVARSHSMRCRWRGEPSTPRDERAFSEHSQRLYLRLPWASGCSPPSRPATRGQERFRAVWADPFGLQSQCLHPSGEPAQWKPTRYCEGQGISKDTSVHDAPGRPQALKDKAETSEGNVGSKGRRWYPLGRLPTKHRCELCRFEWR
jgi:hypothetical protein